MAVYTTSSNIQRMVKPRTLAELIYDSTMLGALDTDAKVSDALANADAVAVVNYAIAQASTYIDSYLLGHVDLTDATKQAAVQTMCTDIALYYLYRRRYLDNEQNPHYEAYKQASRRLEKIQARELHLGTNPDVPASQIVSSTSSDDRTLNDDTLGGF